MADQVDLFAALRPELDGAMLQVVWSDLANYPEREAGCRPWPWAICGVGDGPTAELFGAVIPRPVIWYWFGSAPAWLPAHARLHTRWRSLAADVSQCLGRSIGGVSLAPNRGLLGPRAELVLSPELEALIASSPAPVTMPARGRAAATRVVTRHRLPLLLASTGSGMRVEEAA